MAAERRQTVRTGEVGHWLGRWLDAETEPMALIETGLKLIWANNAAQRLLRSCVDITFSRGLVGPTDRMQNEAFLRFLRAAGTEPTSYSLPRTDQDGHLVFRAKRIDARRGEGVVSLIIRDSAARQVPKYADLTRTLGLTRSEAAVISALLSGETAEQAATRLQITLDTARTHIRNVYAKLGVSSREALFARLSPYRTD